MTEDIFGLTVKKDEYFLWKFDDDYALCETPTHDRNQTPLRAVQIGKSSRATSINK